MSEHIDSDLNESLKETVFEKTGHKSLSTVRLNNGVTMPSIGFGCAFGNWTDPNRFMGFQPELGHFAISTAIRSGYRHFDGAFVYGSHRVLSQHIGQALAVGLVKRSDIFITTKICHPSAKIALNNIKKTFDFESIPDGDIKARVWYDFETSLDELGLGYVDLLLMHWPGSFNSSDEESNQLKRKLCWEAFEEIYRSGKARAIGVSNFLERHLAPLIREAKINPMVNQIEISPYIQQSEIVSFCRRNGICITSWGPFGSGQFRRRGSITNQLTTLS